MRGLALGAFVKHGKCLDVDVCVCVRGGQLPFTLKDEHGAFEADL